MPYRGVPSRRPPTLNTYGIQIEVDQLDTEAVGGIPRVQDLSRDLHCDNEVKLIGDYLHVGDIECSLSEDFEQGIDIGSRPIVIPYRIFLGKQRLDTEPGGSTETIFDTSIPPNLDRNTRGTINALIAEDSAWEFAFRIQGWVGDMFVPMAKEPEMTELVGEPHATDLVFHLPPGPEGAPRYAKYEGVALVSVDPAVRTITFQIPLEIIGQPEPGWKFVLYMAGVEWGNARVVLAQAGEWNFGGGSDDDIDPNIIDMLGPQEEILDYTQASPVVLPGIPLIPEED